MKKFYSLFLLSLIASTLTAQTTRRVNGDPDITGVNVYNTIQAAVDAANTDDVILIEPYGANINENPAYTGTTQIDKKLHFRGNGYFLDNPLNALTPLDQREANFGGQMVFEFGSSGSTVRNLKVSTIEVYTDNILFESVFSGSFTSYSLENSSVVISEGINCTIRKSIIQQGIRDYRGGLSKINSNLNLIIENTLTTSLTDIDNSIIKNSQISNMGQTDNSIFTNCIFFSKVIGIDGGGNYNNAISYCISFQNDLPTLGNNMNNVAWQQLFVGPNYIQYYSNYAIENDSELSNSSVGKNAGINGGDIGIYGGTYPYEKSGLPHHPISTFFINSGIGNNAIDIDAVITIKAN